MRSIADRFACASWYLADDCFGRKKITPELRKHAADYFTEAQKLTDDENKLLVCVREKRMRVLEKMNKKSVLVKSQLASAEKNDSLIDITERKSKLENLDSEKQDQLATDCLEIVESEKYVVEKKQEALSCLQALGDQKNQRALCALGYAKLFGKIDEHAVASAADYLARAVKLPFENKNEAIRELLYAELVTRAKDFPLVCPILADYQIPRVKHGIESGKVSSDDLCTMIFELHSFMKDAGKAKVACTEQLKKVDELTERAIEKLFRAEKIVLALELMKSHDFVHRGLPTENEMRFRLARYWLRFSTIQKGLSEKAITLLDPLVQKNDSGALKEAIAGIVHGAIEYNDTLLSLCKSLYESEPILALQFIDYGAKEKRLIGKYLDRRIKIIKMKRSSSGYPERWRPIKTKTRVHRLRLQLTNTFYRTKQLISLQETSRF